MSILITGGAGFVGLEVARQLLAGGETDITVFSRNPSARRLGGESEGGGWRRWQFQPCS
jgi:nucleoside-diphosphate-sugar epimerase